MNVTRAVGLIVAALAAAAPAGAGAQIAGKWVGEKCGLRPGHFLVNSGVLHLKSAVESRFADQRQKKLAEAEGVLLQAVTSADQQGNPAAWYYLGRYYLLRDDLAGADSALTKAAELRPECAEDIDFWRQAAWVPTFNAGVTAWQGGDTDSAIAAFRRAHAIYRGDPKGSIYLAVLYANTDHPDSAIVYFRQGIAVAGDDTAHADDKRQATFNLARMYHRTERWDDAARTYAEYLAATPNDVEATAALAAVFTAAGRRDSAVALYARVLERADSVPFLDLFNAGVAIFRGAPPFPDTAAVAERCRAAVRGTVAAVRRACRDSVAAVVRAHDAVTAENFRLAGRAFAAVLDQNPHYRDALFNLANVLWQVRDTQDLLPVARRLVTVDPMNRTSNLILAQAYQMRARGDSALHYLQVADSILPVEVNITELRMNEAGAAVGGLITNFHAQASAPLTLEFEFLTPKGDVVSVKTLEVEALDAGANHAFRVEAEGQGITAYRYRPKG